MNVSVLLPALLLTLLSGGPGGGGRVVGFGESLPPETKRATATEVSAGPLGVRPNIVFLLADDLRYDGLGYTGNRVIRTPALDALAAEGTVFDSAYVTTSICSVSRASILSGQYGRRHDLWGFGGGFDSVAFAKTYPARLRAAGYRTGFIGKYGVGEYAYASRQFDFWAGFDGQGSYAGRTGRDGRPIHLTAWMAERAEDFIAAAGTGGDTTSFALSVSFKAPHADGLNDFSKFDPAFADEYVGAPFPQPVQAEVEHFDYYPPAWQEPNEARQRWRARLGDPVDAQAHLEGYYRLVHGLDSAVTRIVAALEAAGVADNTVIVFTSDNGFYQGEYGLSGKWYASEASIHVPMLLWDGRDRQARRRPELALNVDVAPTLLALANLAPSEGTQGESLLPLVSDAPAVAWRERFLYEHLWPGPNPIPSVECVVAPPFKYARHFRGFREGPLVFEETLDLAADPYELRNLSGVRPALRDSLARELAGLIEALE